jgi:hypothetical protein
MHRRLASLILVAVWGAPAVAAPPLELVSAEVQAVFAGSNRVVNLCWHNSGNAIEETDIKSRMMQVTSATAVCVGEAPWKKLQVLPGQSVLDTATLAFPQVRAKTRFLVQWTDSNSNVLGSTEVFAYPTNLLTELGVLVNHNEGALGVYDPENELKPLLKNCNVGFVDLENMTAENFRGKLAIVGGFTSKPGVKSLVTSQVKKLAENGVAVVWVKSSEQSPDCDEPEPSFYSVTKNQVATVISQPAMVTGLAENPHSQLNLIYFCELALRPSSPASPPTVHPN